MSGYFAKFFACFTSVSWNIPRNSKIKKISGTRPSFPSSASAQSIASGPSMAFNPFPTLYPSPMSLSPLWPSVSSTALYPLPRPSAALNRPLSPLWPCVPSTALYPSTEAKQHTYLFSEMFRRKRVSSKTLCSIFKNKFKHLFYMEKNTYLDSSAPYALCWKKWKPRPPAIG